MDALAFYDDLAKKTADYFVARPLDWTMGIPKNDVLLAWAAHFGIAPDKAESHWVHMTLQIDAKPSLIETLNRSHEFR